MKKEDIELILEEGEGYLIEFKEKPSHIEKMGTGIARMQLLVKEAGLHPIEFSFTTTELSKFVGISTRKIKENTAKLKSRNKLKHIGPAKGGHWEILSE